LIKTNCGFKRTDAEFWSRLFCATNFVTILNYDERRNYSKIALCETFLFVDTIQKVDEDGVIGTYRYDESLAFYKGHFIDKPVTPGVILTETMAQIGVVCLGILF